MIKTIDKFKLPEGLYVPFLGYRWYRLLSGLERRHIMRLPLNASGVTKRKRARQLIVSLTTYPARIDASYFAVKSLMRQTVKPDRIELWLSHEQFEHRDLPAGFRELERYGLEIRYCDDLKSHKKYYNALKEQKDDLVITYDDDLIYPENSLALLYDAYHQYPDCIICNRGMEITTDHNRTVNSYSKWKALSKEGVMQPSYKIMPSTGAGTLYPPGVLDDEVFHLDAIKKYAYTADDLWMKTMSLLKQTKVVKTKRLFRTLTLIEKNQTECLGDMNHKNGGNDRCLKSLMDAYPSAFTQINYVGANIL